MNVNGFSQKEYGWKEYGAQAAAGSRRQASGTQEGGRFAAEYARTSAKSAQAGTLRKWDVTCSSTNVVLHGADNLEGEVVTAWANVVSGTSMTVYKPQGFDPANPVYKVKMWDASGKEQEFMVDISKVNPMDCNTIEMYAYSAHLSDSGECPDALERFLMAQAHYRDSIANYGCKNLFDRTNWLQVVKDVMQMQYKAGNLKGYLEYKGFLGFLMRKTSEKKDLVERTLDEKKVDTDIQVKPDGSRVLVMTRQIGGMSTTTSMEISKPTQMPNDTKAQEDAVMGTDAGWQDTGSPDSNR